MIMAYRRRANQRLCCLHMCVVYRKQIVQHAHAELIPHCFSYRRAMWLQLQAQSNAHAQRLCCRRSACTLGTYKRRHTSHVSQPAPIDAQHAPQPASTHTHRQIQSIASSQQAASLQRVLRAARALCAHPPESAVYTQVCVSQG